MCSRYHRKNKITASSKLPWNVDMWSEVIRNFQTTGPLVLRSPALDQVLRELVDDSFVFYVLGGGDNEIEK